MGAGHSHTREHTHRETAWGRNKRRLAIVLALIAIYMVAEVIGGLLTNSLALLADAGHMLSDAGALALSLFAIWIAQRPATPSHTYGYYRTEILAALANGATLVAISIYIFIEAFRRFGEPSEVQCALMMGIAVGGLLINLAGLWILNAGKSESLNIRGAWLHVLTDAIGSVGAIVAGALIWAFSWNWVGPACLGADRRSCSLLLLGTAKGDRRRPDGRRAWTHRCGRGPRCNWEHSRSALCTRPPRLDHH